MLVGVVALARGQKVQRCAVEGETCVDCFGEVRYGRGSFLERSKERLKRQVNGSAVDCRQSSFYPDKLHRGGPKDCVCKSWVRRVALCFWGVNRSLNVTIASAERMLIQPLIEQGAFVDLFFHTYTLSHVDSTWAGERHSKVGGPIDELERLTEMALNFEGRVRMKRWEATDQSELDKGTDWHFYKNLQAGYREDTVKNVLRAAFSLKRVTDLWLAEEALNGGRKDLLHSQKKDPGFIGEPQRRLEEEDELEFYDAVVYARPDLNYTTPIDVDLLFSLRPNELYTPIWSTFHGVNDRFAAGHPEAAIAFGRRLVDIKDYVALGHGVHSESVVAYMLDKHDIELIHVSDPCGNRVRSTGLVSQDCGFVEKRYRKHASLANPLQYRQDLINERRQVVATRPIINAI